MHRPILQPVSEMKVRNPHPSPDYNTFPIPLEWITPRRIPIADAQSMSTSMGRFHSFQLRWNYPSPDLDSSRPFLDDPWYPADEGFGHCHNSIELELVSQAPSCASASSPESCHPEEPDRIPPIISMELFPLPSLSNTVPSSTGFLSTSETVPK